LGDIRKRVAEGTPLHDALAAHPNVFDELTISIVRAGTEGAFLEQALEQTAGFLDLQEEVRGRIKSAMAYPAFLAAAGGVVTVVLIVFFVPKFAELFAQLEQAGTLPGATIALLWLSDTLGRFGVLIGLGFVGIIYAIRRWKDAPAGRKRVDRWKLKLPLLGPLFLNTAVARFCRILGTLLHNGVPLLKALEISSDSAGNVQLAEAIRSSAENVATGESLSQPLARCGLIPRNVMAMITIAEESNNLDGVLNNIADNVDRKTARQLDMLVRLVEPALLMVMGSAVLFVIVALLLPVFEMSTSMG
jgi:general secretion pathway protein F/type IV pilus assembly protein PilC